MDPKELRNNVATVHVWQALLSYWSAALGLSVHDARVDLTSNKGGDYSVTEKDGTWVFENDRSGEKATWNAANNEFVGEMMGKVG